MIKELEGTERAFPQVFERTMEDGTKATTIRYGMTLRDYFAAKAMQAIMDRSKNTPFPDVARYAYMQADEMLKARKQ